MTLDFLIPHSLFKVTFSSLCLQEKGPHKPRRGPLEGSTDIGCWMEWNKNANTSKGSSEDLGEELPLSTGVIY